MGIVLPGSNLEALFWVIDGVSRWGVHLVRSKGFLGETKSKAGVSSASSCAVALELVTSGRRARENETR